MLSSPNPPKQRRAAFPSIQRVARLAAGLLLFWTAAASAQLLDTVEVTRDGSDALVRIKFVPGIQYLRHAPATRGQTVQVFFQITESNEAARTVLEEQRRSPPNDLLPRFDVTYPTQAPGFQRRFEIKFAEAVTYRLRPENNHTILLIVPLSEERLAALAPAKPAGVIPPPPTAAAPTTDLDQTAAPLMNSAREALAAGEFEAAAQALNRVLNLPPNTYSQDAQELIGLARERLGETAKAKVEYELYLKLYPDGPGAARVKARIAELSVAPVLGRPVAPAPPAYSAWGSVSQYYYGGQSQIETTTITTAPVTNATTIDTARLSGTDQSQLVTNVDATGRWRQGPWDTRFVVRDSYAWNFLKDGDDRNRLTALYAETRYAPENVYARIGRQSATAGGIIGRFDGAVASWAPRPDWRLNGAVGSPVDTIQGLRKIFAGASVDVENVLPRTSVSLFGIGQRVEGGETDRVGVGTEVRFFDNQRLVYVLLDYDPMFNAFNAAMAQGSWQFPTGTSVNLLADYRRSPILQLTNAVLAAPTVSFQTLVQTLGVDATRDLAKAFTPISKVYLVGLTQQATPQWQIGFDFRISSLSGTPASEFLPAQPGTGNVYTYTLQAIGTSLTPWRDILVANGSVLQGKLLDGWQIGLDYRFSPWEPLTLEPMYRYYQQKDSLGTKLARHLPGVRVIYLVRARVSLEGEYSMEKTHSSGTSVIDDSTRHFWYVGWRWDF